jgi:hypothetical protein
MSLINYFKRMSNYMEIKLKIIRIEQEELKINENRIDFIDCFIILLSWIDFIAFEGFLN